MAQAAGQRTHGLSLTFEEGEKLLRVVAQSLPIRRHFELFRWLQGEVQYFLPHQILLCAWGDFPNWNLKLDVVSALPGVRTSELANCKIDRFLKDLFGRWVANQRQPLSLCGADAIRALEPCGCALHHALEQCSFALVHGFRDERAGHESLYIALHTRSLGAAAARQRAERGAELLIPQIDMACRRVAAYAFADGSTRRRLPEWPEVSPREHQILDWVSKGKTNEEIGAVLNISPYTVKNHVRRILKKLGAENRTQAATKYHQALLASQRLFSGRNNSLGG